MSIRHLSLCTLGIWFIFGCESSNGPSPDSFSDSPGAIIAPAAKAKFVPGDTIEITWSNPIESPVVSYNYNDSIDYYFMGAEWHDFPDARIVSHTNTSAKVIALDTNCITENFRLKVREKSSGKATETGPLNLDLVVVLSPVGGHSYKVGETVPIKFKRTRSMSRVFVGFVYGTTPVKAFNLTPPNTPFEFKIGLNDAPRSTYDTTWVIGTETAMVPGYPSDSCFIYAWAYGLGEQFQGDPEYRRSNNWQLLSDHNETPFKITAN